MSMVERADATVREKWDTDARTYTMWSNGTQTMARPFTALENAWAEASVAEQAANTNVAALHARARAALAADQAYLTAVATGTVTQAQAIQQVAALTRQVQALIRLIVAGDLLTAIDSP